MKDLITMLLRLFKGKRSFQEVMWEKPHLLIELKNGKTDGIIHMPYPKGKYDYPGAKTGVRK